jgi:pimeloyl-ACP methyl ester carboxylesterase
MANFLLIHGGWQGGWCWDGVVEILTSAGHSCYAPTLRGCEETADNRGVGLEAVTVAVIDAVRQQDLRDLVVVAHSGGGAVAQGVVDRLAERVMQGVWMNAWVLKDGESILDVLPGDMATELRTTARNDLHRVVPMDPETFKRAFLNDGTEQQFAEYLPRLVPVPLGWITEPLYVDRFFDLRIPFSYVHMREDIAAPRSTYEAMAARLPNVTRYECGGSHQVMMSDPAEVASVLLKVIEDSPA